MDFITKPKIFNSNKNIKQLLTHDQIALLLLSKLRENNLDNDIDYVELKYKIKKYNISYGFSSVINYKQMNNYKNHP